MTKKILPAFLAALMLFTSLGLSSEAQEVRAETETVGATKTEEEYKVDIANIKSEFNGAFSGTSGDWTGNSNYDTSWYTSENTYTLTTAAEVAGMAYLITNGTNFSGKTIKLGADIDLGAHYWIPAGGIENSDNVTSFSNVFSGTFDGSGFSIRNMKINQPNLTYTSGKDNYLGFFSLNNGAIKNVTFEKPVILAVSTQNTTSQLREGTVVAANMGTVDNCHVVGGKLYGEVNRILRLGGVVGYQSYAANRITQNCTTSADTNVYAVNWSKYDNCYANVSGIVADNASSIDNSINNANITAYVNGGSVGQYRHFIGGIVGHNFNEYYGFLQNSVNTGDVKAYIMNGQNASNDTQGFGVGGVAGASYLNTTGCYNTGDITLTGGAGTTMGGAGGVMGIIRGGNIQNCYNTGKITSDGKQTGGLTGQTTA
ncbi:MAG: hypothetical protein RR614_04570, partial [Eubacterium sp.]